MLPERVNRLVETICSAAGKLEAGVRQKIADGARGASGSLALGGDPDPLHGWIDKVSRHAYKCTDEDVAALIAAGYSEDQIYEATIAAAVGAGLHRFERGLSLLRGGNK
jgi:alkylhydroperoxidase family enzyme